VDMPAGCAFNPRCPLQHDRCRTETPDLLQVGPDRQVSCHLYPEHSVLPPVPEKRAREGAIR
jgi:ABC-type antimicrobial peptide transport system ATPase subunit